MEYWAIIKRISIILLLSLFVYLGTAYLQLVSINRFCIENSYGIPLETLGPKFNDFSFLTDVKYIKGYMDEDIWVDPEFEINSRLASDQFGCNIMLGFKSSDNDSVITIGHYMLEEFGNKYIKISLL